MGRGTGCCSVRQTGTERVPEVGGLPLSFIHTEVMACGCQIAQVVKRTGNSRC